MTAGHPVGQWTSSWKYGVKMAGVNDSASITTPAGGEIATMKAKDDMTALGFKGDQVEECLQWVDPGLGRDKVCKKRGMVANQEGVIQVPTKYIKGTKVGDKIQTVDDFPVESYKNKKLTALFGVAL